MKKLFFLVVFLPFEIILWLLKMLLFLVGNTPFALGKIHPILTLSKYVTVLPTMVFMGMIAVFQFVFLYPFIKYMAINPNSEFSILIAQRLKAENEYKERNNAQIAKAREQ